MKDVIIVGGGIAGLTAALALLRQGRDVCVLEQAPAFGEVAAGISLSQPAIRGLFSLGLAEAIEQAGDAAAQACTADLATGERAEGSEFVAHPREPGAPPLFYHIHRADLHRILVERIQAIDPKAIILDRPILNILQDGDKVWATCKGGNVVKARVLIGVDGARSTVRELLFGVGEPRFTGKVAYRFLVPTDDVRGHLGLGSSVCYADEQRSLFRYLIRHGSLVNGISFAPSERPTEDNWETPVSRAELLAQFAGANADVVGLLKAAPPETLRKRALFDSDPLSFWTVGRVALLGDAVHTTLPFLGFGAAMGIEDAVVLGRAFTTTEDPCEALYIYELTRKARAKDVLLASRRQGELDRQPQERLTPALRADELMHYDPATVPLAA
jgi:salicylate hydroxylase